MSNISSFQAFALKDELTVTEGKGRFPQINIDNDYASSIISIYGAQVLSFKSKLKSESKQESKQENPNDDLLFVSDAAYFEQGKAIKGGIPICWPWFGKDESKPDKPMHGFVRSMLWELNETKSLSDGSTQVVLSISDSAETRKLWSHHFKLTLTIVVGKTLHLSLRSENTGEIPFEITQALHTYFSVPDITQVELKGLDQVNYLDKVTGAKKIELQVGDISINQEVDRIYLDSPAKLTLIDSLSEKEITIKSSGNKTAVVWNPWITISKNSGDLTDDAYQQFICVETANAADDTVVIDSGKSHTIAVEYTIS